MKRSALATVTSPRAIASLGCLLALCVAFASPAHAASITFSSLQFTLNNQNSDGSGVVTNGGLSLMITGPNNGGGLPGTTDLVTTAPTDGTVSFDYTYSSLDMATFDYAGYLLQGVFVQLADTDGESGSTSFAVTSGESFGFRVGSLDNEGEPGIFTVSDFGAPGGAAPEPGTLFPVVAGVILIMVSQWKRRRVSSLVLADDAFRGARRDLQNVAPATVSKISRVSQ